MQTKRKSPKNIPIITENGLDFSQKKQPPDSGGIFVCFSRVFDKMRMTIEGF